MRVARGRAGVVAVLRQDRPQELSEAGTLFERLRDAFRAALDAATPPGDLRDLARQMREAVIEAKVAVQEMREALGRTEGELALERQRLADAERRGRLAAEIQDQETVTVAERFAVKHRERVGVLERKLAAQREEVALAERELGEMQGQLKSATQGRAAAEGDRSTDRAWREVGVHGLQDDLLKADLDRAAREATADQQLEALKKKMRKD